MSSDDELDAFLRAGLRSEASSTRYSGGLTQPVFIGVRKRRQRRMVATTAAATSLALLAGTGVMLAVKNRADDTAVAPAGQNSAESVGPLPSTSEDPTSPPTTTTSGTPARSGTTATRSSAPSRTTAGDRSATDWSRLSAGESAKAVVEYVQSGSDASLKWGGRTVRPSGLTSVARPGLRIATADNGTNYVVVKSRGTQDGADSAVAVDIRGQGPLAFPIVVGNVVENPQGNELAAAQPNGQVEIRTLRDNAVASGFLRPAGDAPMTWSGLGIVFKSGDIVNREGVVVARVPGIKTVSTAGSGALYAVTDNAVLRVSPQGTSQVGTVRAGEGTAFAAAAPDDDFVATTGGVLDRATGQWIVQASGAIEAIQWVSADTVVFVREKENVRCNVASRHCETANRNGLDRRSLFSW